MVLTTVEQLSAEDDINGLGESEEVSSGVVTEPYQPTHHYVTQEDVRDDVAITPLLFSGHDVDIGRYAEVKSIHTPQVCE